MWKPERLFQGLVGVATADRISASYGEELKPSAALAAADQPPWANVWSHPVSGSSESTAASVSQDKSKTVKQLAQLYKSPIMPRAAAPTEGPRATAVALAEGTFSGQLDGELSLKYQAHSSAPRSPNPMYRSWLRGGQDAQPPSSLQMDNRGPLGEGQGQIASPSARRPRQHEAGGESHPAAAGSAASARGAATGPGVPVRMGRGEAWARFLAYEGCLQVCLQEAGGSAEAASFLQDGCSALRSDFKFDGLLLQPGAHADKPSPAGSVILWDDGEAALPALGCKLPTSGSRATMKATAVRFRPASGAGDDQGPFGWLKRFHQEQLYICLHPQMRTEEQGAWALVGAGGQTRNGDVVEVGADERLDELLVELHDCTGRRARGAVCIADLWQAATAEEGDGEVAGRRRRRGLLQRLCACGGLQEEEDAAGRIWVDILDGQGHRFGQVALASWLAAQEQLPLAAQQQSPKLAASLARSRGGLMPSLAAPSGGYLQITAWQVYDVALDAALRAQHCGPRRLAVTGAWAWLLRNLAATYGIRATYASLSHLRWAVRPDNVTPTADCLGLLARELAPLKRAEAGGALLPQEVAMVSRVCCAAEALVAHTAEAYHSLCEAAPSGLAEGAAPPTDGPAPALAPAIVLFGLLRDALRPEDQRWLAERFRAAAARRYQQLSLAACEHATAAYGDEGGREAALKSPGCIAYNVRAGAGGGTAGEAGQGGGGGGALAAYARLEALCRGIRAELEADMAIHQAAVLPSFLNLPALTSARYCQELMGVVAGVLAAQPPLQPSREAVRLLTAVGRLQEWLAQHDLLPRPGQPGALDAAAVFQPHIRHWILGSQEALAQQCRRLEAGLYARDRAGADAQRPDDATGGQPAQARQAAAVSAVVTGMVPRIAAEVRRYEDIITFWPAMGPCLEAAACSALRDTTAALSRQCGLVRCGDDAYTTPSASPYRAGGAIRNVTPTSLLKRTARAVTNSPAHPHTRSPEQQKHGVWRWQASPCMPAVHGGGPRCAASPAEALLLNSLRRLLAVAPHTERALNAWCGGAAAPPSRSPLQGRAGGAEAEAAAEGPGLGAQFAQVVKELRSQYAAAVTMTAERLSAALFASRTTSPAAILQRSTVGPLHQQVGPLLGGLEEALAALRGALEGRVYVALARGLWDATAQELFHYCEALQEGMENQTAWRTRQAAAAMLESVDRFFQQALSAGLAHELQEKDLDPPLHSDKAHKLLADTSVGVNLSYTVF